MTCSWFLLAETLLAESARKHTEEAAAHSNHSIWLYLLIPIAVLALGVAIVPLFARSPEILDTPLGLLGELCHTHRIKGRLRRLIERIAEEAQLEHPATMFLSAARFDAAVEAARKRMDLDPKQINQMDQVRQKLFC